MVLVVQQLGGTSLAGAEKSGWDDPHAPQVIRGAFDREERNSPESQD